MNPRTGFVLSVVLLGILCPAHLLAQATNPAYLAEMPSVDRVLQAMQTSDPDETAARQMGALLQLKTMIEDISGPRQFQKGGLTPDENKYRQAYYTAYYQITQLKPQYKSFPAMRGYDLDPKFRNELIQKLFPPTFAAEYPKLMAQGKGQTQVLHTQAEQIRAQQAAKEQAEAQKNYNKLQADYESGKIRGPQTPAQKALNRCVTAGRPPASCAGNSLLGGFTQMLSQVLPSVAGKQRPPGPTMAGVFQGPGNWRIDFITDGVLVNCSDLSPNQQSYSVKFENGKTLIVIDTTPKPLVLTLTDGGNLVGPGPITIDGVVPGGYSHGISNATQQDAFGNKYDANGNKATETAGYVTFASKRTTCAAQNLSSKGAGTGIETMEFNVLKMAVGADSGPPIPPGVRMDGLYSAKTGLSVEFYPESVIVSCGEPARAYPYQVISNGSQSAIKVEDPTNSLLLNLKSDGTLDPGAGSYLVHGRKIVGQTDDGDFKFSPLEATCNLGVLAPGAAPGSAPAPAIVTASSTAGSSSSAASSAATGNAVLSVTSGFPLQPGAANPFAGHMFVLLRESFDDVLAKSGFPIPAGTQPFKAMILACNQHSPDCSKAVTAINAQTVSGGKLDALGKGTLSGIPPGTYYLMGSAAPGGKPFMWNVKVDLKVGSNPITLDQHNATSLGEPAQASSAASHSANPAPASASQPAASSTAPATPTNSPLAQGDKFFEAKNYPQAIDAYKHAIAQNATLQIAYENLGSVYNETSQFDKAVTPLREAVRLKPDSETAWRELGLAYFNLERFSNSLQTFQQAAQLKPDDTSLNYWLGTNYLKLEQYDKAIAFLREAVRLDPSDTASLSYLGLAYFAAQQFPQAAEAIQQFLRLQSNSGEYQLLGISYVRMGKKAEAMAVYNKLKTMDPKAAEELSQEIQKAK